LLHNYIFNGKVIESSINLEKFIKNNFGFKILITKILILRFENTLNRRIMDLTNNELKQFIKIIYSIIPYKASVYSRFCLNIYLLDLATCYKG
jgi:hypothetical protein